MLCNFVFNPDPLFAIIFWIKVDAFFMKNDSCLSNDILKNSFCSRICFNESQQR